VVRSNSGSGEPTDGELHQRIEELHTIYRLSDEIIQAETIEDVYDATLKELQRALKADRIGLLLFDRHGELRFRASRGLSETYREAVEIYLSDARDAKDPRPVFMSDAQATARLEALLSAILEERVRGIAYVPLIHRGVLLGRLNICYRSPHQFSAEERRLIQTFATHIALSIKRKRVELELSASEERYRLLFERNPSGVCTTTLSGDILDCNESFARIFGYQNRESVLLAGAPALYPRSEDRNDFLARLLEHRTLNNIELCLRRADGSPVWVLGNVTLVPGDDGRPTVVEGIWINITERKLAEGELKTSREALRALSAHLQSVREEERKRIAREIHDELGQALTRLRIDLSLLAGELPSNGDGVSHKIKFMCRLLEGTIKSVGRICAELRPSLLDHLGLDAAIDQELTEFQSRTGISSAFDFRQVDLCTSKEHATTLFRIFQEALTNVARHADASKVETHLTREEGQLRLTIRDNGKGIGEAPINDPASLGLIGMRERALQLGGTLEIKGNNGSGTSVTVSIPV
jgi:PAS domain S-box-containing protein